MGMASEVTAGQSVAITAGSRGISNIADIIKSTADFFSQLGAKPFLVPAMGSHGGGTAEGQRQVIESYGITEEFCGCPIRASMETVVIGEAKEGFPIFFDKYAYEADHVVVCGRIKPHTNFAGDIQSGLMKMMMIGLGKKDGASLYHHAIFDHGFPQIIRSVAPKVIEHANISVGLAIVENASDDTASIEAIRPADFEVRETQLLRKARSWMPRLPFQQIDLLVIDEIGKNISGTGMDTNVIGRKQTEKAADQPNITNIFVRNLSTATHGNASGIGFAEICLGRVVEEMNLEATVLNCVTALDISAARIPIHYETDAEALGIALSILGLQSAETSRLVWIRNTGHLEELLCSEAMMSEIEATETLEILSELQEMPLRSNGMLPDDFF